MQLPKVMMSYNISFEKKDKRTKKPQLEFDSFTQFDLENRASWHKTYQ